MNSRKLGLRREELAPLTETDLALAAGGSRTQDDCPTIVQKLTGYTDTDTLQATRCFCP